MNSEELKNKLIEILLKKAEGYYYFEEQEDYEKTQIKSKNNDKIHQNISMFDIFVTDNTTKTNTDVNINSSNGNEEKDNKNLTLVKKKVTKHYIPPDMLAIKILFEINKEKVNDNELNNLTDEELLNLKDKLIGELLNDNKQN